MGKTHQRHRQPEAVTHSRRKDRLVDPHPTREDRGRRESDADGTVGHHEHLGGPRVLGEVRLLDLDGGQDHGAEGDA